MTRKDFRLIAAQQRNLQAIRDRFAQDFSGKKNASAETRTQQGKHEGRLSQRK